MKKFVSLLLALLLAAAAPLTVLAEENEMIKPFEGLVSEVFDGGFLMEDIQMGLLQINVDDNTVLDGILSIEPIEVGMYVIVDHNGMMTRSIPAQVYALRVGCHTLNGVASQMTEEGVLLTGDPIFGEVFVQMTPTMATVFPGVPMLVYYDGVMTMSLPGKVNARHVLVPELTGVVSEKDGAGFTLTDEDGNTYRILTSDSLLVGELAANEDEPLPGSAEAALTEEGTELAVDEAVDAATETEAGEAAGSEAEEAAADEAATETIETDEPVAETSEEGSGGEAAEATEPTDETVADPASVADTSESDETTETDPNLIHDVTIPTGAKGDAMPAADILWGDGDTVTVYHQGPMDAQSGAELIALGLLVKR